MEDLVVYADGLPIGIVSPSTVYSTDNSMYLVNGPKGVSKLLSGTEKSLLSALKESGALIPGSTEEIEKVQALIADPITSRTVSYLLCTVRSCFDVIKKMEALRNANLIILGCGGIGSNIAMLLAGVGVKKLTLIDADSIESSNFNRQLFWEKKDIGKLKVDVLRSAIRNRFEHVEVDAHAEEMSIAEVDHMAKQGIDGVAVTADSPGTLAWDAHVIAKSKKIPVVSGGYFHKYCVANYFCPLAETVVEESDAMAASWKRLPNSIMPSYGPNNMEIASILCSSLISSIVGSMPSGNKFVTWDSTVSPQERRLNT